MSNLGIYEKQTKDTVDFPAYTLCFLGIIINKLEFYGLIDGKSNKLGTEVPSTLVIPIVMKKYKYCYEGIDLIEKTLKRRGYNCKMEHYTVIDVDEKDGSKTKGFKYEFKVSKA